MRMVSVPKPGGFSSLRVIDGPAPNVKPGEVLIDVKAAGVNFADCIARMGLYASAWHYSGWPLTPGFEVAGIVAQCGTDVPVHFVGRRVVAVTRFGGYAEKITVPFEQCFVLPDTTSFQEGASFPVIFLTASYALNELCCPPKDLAVLIHSAAGGVGGALVQLSRLNRNKILAVVGSSAKTQAALDHGADAVISKDKGDWETQARKFSSGGFLGIFDASGDTLRESYSLLAPRGRLIAYGSHSVISRNGGILGIPLSVLRYLFIPRYSPLRLTNDNKSIMGFNLSYLFEERVLLKITMTNIINQLTDGRLVFPRITTYPLERAADAHRALQSGHTVGKVVLTVDAASSH